MGKVEGIIKSEIVRLARREIRKISVPLGRDVWSLKSAVSQIRKAVLTLQRITASQQKELEKGKTPIEATPEEVKESRFSPRLIGSLRRHLGITQKELAILTGVTVGAAHLWEIGQFKPKHEEEGGDGGASKAQPPRGSKAPRRKRDPDGGKEGSFAQEETYKKGPWEITFHFFMKNLDYFLRGGRKSADGRG